MTANRAQWEWRSVDWECLPPADHRARAAWAFAEGLERGPLHEEIRAVEGGFATLDEIDAAAAADSHILAPVKPPKNPRNDPDRPRRPDSRAVAPWPLRMATPEAKEIYKQRAVTCVNARARHRGLRPFLVRGMLKAKAIVPWHPLAHHLRRLLGPGPRPALAA
jgi:hypothetical protein